MKADDDMEIAKTLTDEARTTFSSFHCHVSSKPNDSGGMLQLRRIARERKSEARSRIYRILGDCFLRRPFEEEQETNNYGLSGHPMTTSRIQ